MVQKQKQPNGRAFTVPEVWRAIVKKNERQGDETFDVLVCSHAVPANDNRYRRARSCPECRVKVQKYADDVAASQATSQKAAPPARVRRRSPPRRRAAPATASRTATAPPGACESHAS